MSHTQQTQRTAQPHPHLQAADADKPPVRHNGWFDPDFDAADDMLATVGGILFYIGLGMALFAVLLLSGYIWGR